MIFGETTQDGWRRIQHHVTALRGRISNNSDKWDRVIPKINKTYKCNISKELDKVQIWFRPHSITDDAHKYSRQHSGYMETQAQAQYRAIWGYGTIGNTRDLPSQYLIENSREFLKNKGIKVYEPVSLYDKLVQLQG